MSKSIEFHSSRNYSLKNPYFSKNFGLLHLVHWCWVSKCLLISLGCPRIWWGTKILWYVAYHWCCCIWPVQYHLTLIHLEKINAHWFILWIHLCTCTFYSENQWNMLTITIITASSGQTVFINNSQIITISSNGDKLLPSRNLWCEKKNTC